MSGKVKVTHKSPAYRVLPLNVVTACLRHKSERTGNLPLIAFLPLIDFIPIIGFLPPYAVRRIEVQLYRRTSIRGTKTSTDNLPA
jgi:hypothetical protein